MRETDIFHRLSHAFHRRQLGHGLLFFHSDTQYFRSSLGFWSFLKTLLCQQKSEPRCVCESCRLMSESFHEVAHPDLITLASEPGTKGYSVEQTRDALQRLSLASGLSPHRVLWIENAERLNLGSAAPSNVLLKSLEEPRPHQYLILTTIDPDSQLQTIQSRVQCFFLGNQSRHMAEIEESWRDFFLWFQKGSGTAPICPADKEGFWKERELALDEIRQVATLSLKYLREKVEYPSLAQFKIIEGLEKFHSKVLHYAHPALQWSEFRSRASIGN